MSLWTLATGAAWLSVQVLAQVAAAPANAGGTPAAAPSSVQVQSVWDFAAKGGPVMIPIGICSLVALAVIVERLVSLRRRRVIGDDLLAGLRRVFDDQVSNRAAALEYCRTSGTAMAAVLAAGLKKLGSTREVLEKYMAEAAEREVLALRTHLRLLSVITSIAPLLGLLGTIFGMITAFQTVAASGEALGKTELLAKGIYEAMITTAAGLMVAIPTLACYHWISARIDGLVQEMNHVASEFLEAFSAPAAVPQLPSTADPETRAVPAGFVEPPSSEPSRPGGDGKLSVALVPV
ncbi:MAG: MotA/TolQ/ExbB proton channel family protein [Planctomycetes bacterium]|nr:MotA/TolQ/ExbB proton channel family protein [Planctomycetota bacterium]